jgi:thioredoxin-dependent peroxiredoxin
MSKIEVGKKVPAFAAVATDGSPFKLADAKGSAVALYFYPRDLTPGCTIEAQNFRDLQAAFKKAKTLVIGVSRDSCASHQKFIAKEKINFQLLADEDSKLCDLFDVIKDKNMYGKKVRGIERSTFLIDADGKLAREWRKVKVEGHADDVLEAARAL